MEPNPPLSANHPLTALVTGGAGFVMSNVVRHWLESDSAAQAVILDRDAYQGLPEAFFQPVSDRLSYVQGNVLDRRALDDIAVAHEITHVVHAAAVTNGPSGEGGDPARLVEVNVMGTVNLLEWARRLPGLKRFLYVSSGAVYGDPLPESPEAPQPEDGPFNPPELYAATKYASELIARRYGQLFGFDVRRVRFSGVFGPMERPTSARVSMSLPHKMMQAYLEKRPLRVTPETLQAGGDFLSAEDIAVALALLLRKPALGYDVYNVAYGTFTGVTDLFEAFRLAAPAFAWETVEAERAEVVMNPTDRLARWNAYAIDRLTSETGWRPRLLVEQFAGYLRWVEASNA